MLTAFRNALGIPDLRAKLFVTIGLLAIYRLMVFIPTPGVNRDQLQNGALGSDVFALLSFISGGNFEVFSIAALGVIPYITASIIFQLLTSVYPPLEKLQKEGEEGSETSSREIEFFPEQFFCCSFEKNAKNDCAHANFLTSLSFA